MFGFDSAKLLMILGAVLLIGAGVSYGVDAIGDSRERKVRAEWQASALKEAEQGRAAVAQAIANAKADADRQENDRKAREQIEREAQQHNVNEAIKKSMDLDRRYRDALIHNSSCAAQMQEKLLCPVE